MTPEFSFAAFWQIALLLVGAFAVFVQIRAARCVPAKTSLAPWRAKTADAFLLCAIAIFCLVGVGIFCANAARIAFPQIDFRKNVLWLIPATQTLALAALAGAMKIFPNAFPKNFDAEKNARAADWLSPKNPFGVPAFFFAAIFVVGAASLLVQAAVNFLPENVREIFQTEQILVGAWRDSDNALVAALCVPAIAIFTPILEEIIFRAGFYRLLAAKISPVPAAIFSSVLFALMHDSPASYLPLTLLSCLLCFVYEKTGRIAAPILVHALFNANSLFLIAFAPSVPAV